MSDSKNIHNLEPKGRKGASHEGEDGELKISILLLAAGSSSRMGQSKQLLPWGSDTLLTHACKTALKTRVSHVAVVLGANAEKHSELLKSLSVDVVINSEWSTGMGSSIRTGVDYLIKKSPDLAAIVVMACDQPLISTDHLTQLMEKLRKEKSEIVATQYADTFGVPVLFSSKYFGDLMALPHSTGARKIVETNLKRATFVLFEEGKIDLDTPDDYAKFVNQQN